MLKMGRLTFTLKPLLVHPDWSLLLENLIWFECHELHSLCPSKLFPPKEGDPPEGSLGMDGYSASYSSFDLSSSSMSGYYVDQVHGSYHHFILAPHQCFLPSLTSTPHHHGHSWGLRVSCFSPRLPQPSGLCPLLHHSSEEGAATFLHSFLQGFYQH